MGIDPNTAYFLVNDSFNPPKVVQVDRANTSNIILADQDWSNGSGEFMFIEKPGSSYLFNFAKDGQYLSSTSSGTITTKWLAVGMVATPPTKDEKFEISIISDNGFELSVRIKSRSNGNYLEAKNTGTDLLMNSTQSARGIWNLVPLPKLKEIRDNKTKLTWLINHLWYYSSYFGGAVQETVSSTGEESWSQPIGTAGSVEKFSHLKTRNDGGYLFPVLGRLSAFDAKQNLDEVVESVKAWLSLPNNTRWLMIYDNYDTPKLPGKTDPAAVNITNFLPESYQGSIIITTRSSEVRIGQSIQVRKLSDIRDSLEILSTVSRRQELNTDPDAVKLAEELDGLPLALATAGAYLDQTARSFSDYLRLYKESWARLKETSPDLSSYEDRTLYSTWQISFEYITQRNPLATNLLRLWAYFDNEDLWFELLQQGESDNPEWLRELTKDEPSFDSAVRVLSNHGLVEVATSSQESTESKGYSIHGCVHSWTIHALNRQWDYDLARTAVKFVGAHVPGEKDSQPWMIQRRLLQHAARCLYMFSNSLVVDDGLADECHDLGLLYADQGKLVEAEQMYQRALHGYEKAWGPEHTSTLNTVNNLGLLYADQGKLVEAEQMYQRALEGYEEAWGPEHTSTLNTVNNLGSLYRNQGKLVEAERMYQRALQGYEKAWGPEHASTLSTVNNLAALYADQGKLAKAEQMFRRILQSYEKASGPKHTTTLNAVNCLGDIIKRRCYAATKLSASIIVLACIKQLAALCINFPSARFALFDDVGRVFAWNGDDTKSAATFAHQLALNSPDYNACCDGCGTNLNLNTSRHVCRVCEDSDLCGSCFNKLESNGLGEASSSCQGHKFLDLGGISIGKSPLNDDATYRASVEEWLKSIAL